MAIQPIPFGYVKKTDADLQCGIDTLQEHMLGLAHSSGEYKYDDLVLERMEIELDLRQKMEQEDPTFDPASHAGAVKLSERMEELASTDKDYAKLLHQIQDMHDKGQISTSWGILWG